MADTDECESPEAARTYTALRSILQNHCTLHHLSDETALTVSQWFVGHFGAELEMGTLGGYSTI
jgi:hypothetical protein